MAPAAPMASLTDLAGRFTSRFLGSTAKGESPASATDKRKANGRVGRAEIESDEGNNDEDENDEDDAGLDLKISGDFFNKLNKKPVTAPSPANGKRTKPTRPDPKEGIMISKEAGKSRIRSREDAISSPDESESSASDDERRATATKRDSRESRRRESSSSNKSSENETSTRSMANGKKSASSARTTTSMSSSDTESSGSSGSSDSESERKPLRVKAQPEPESETESESESESDTESRSGTVVRRGSRSEVQSREPTFIAGDFELRKASDQTDAADIARLFSNANLEGKQLWYLTAPASLPLAVETTLYAPEDPLNKGLPTFSHGGVDYSVDFEHAKPSDSLKIFAPNKAGDKYKMIGEKRIQMVQVKRVVQLSDVAEDQSSSRPSEVLPAKRPQPAGLKARFRPIGVPDSPPPSTKHHQRLPSAEFEVEMPPTLPLLPNPSKRHEKAEKRALKSPEPAKPPSKRKHRRDEEESDETSDSPPPKKYKSSEKKPRRNGGGEGESPVKFSATPKKTPIPAPSFGLSFAAVPVQTPKATHIPLPSFSQTPASQKKPKSTPTVILPSNIVLGKKTSIPPPPTSIGRSSVTPVPVPIPLQLTKKTEILPPKLVRSTPSNDEQESSTLLPDVPASSGKKHKKGKKHRDSSPLAERARDLVEVKMEQLEDDNVFSKEKKDRKKKKKEKARREAEEASFNEPEEAHDAPPSKKISKIRPPSVLGMSR